MGKKSEEKETKIEFADMKYVKFCPNCGHASISQSPADLQDKIITCSFCHVKFKLVII